MRKTFNIEEIKKAFRKWYNSDQDGEWFDSGYTVRLKNFLSYLIGIDYWDDKKKFYEVLKKLE